MRWLDWSPARLADFVADSLDARRGSWVVGPPGAIAEFAFREDRPDRIQRDGMTIGAVAKDSALRLSLGEQVKAVAFGRWPAIALVMPRAGNEMPRAAGLAALGPDADALLAQERGASLYDLGLGRSEARFAVRTNDPALKARLDAAIGADLGTLMTALGHEILAASPTRVIETRLGRAEIAAPIPPPGGRSPAGPHTHLLPAILAKGRKTPPHLDLPDDFILGATFYPGPNEAG